MDSIGDDHIHGGHHGVDDDDQFSLGILLMDNCVLRCGNSIIGGLRVGLISKN